MRQLVFIDTCQLGHPFLSDPKSNWTEHEGDFCLLTAFGFSRLRMKAFFSPLQTADLALASPRHIRKFLAKVALYTDMITLRPLHRMSVCVDSGVPVLCTVRCACPGGPVLTAHLTAQPVPALGCRRWESALLSICPVPGSFQQIMNPVFQKCACVMIIIFWNNI